MPGIEDLKNLVGNPQVPYETATQTDWRTTRAALGTDLPSDYKGFVEQFGTGCLFNFLYVLHPFSKYYNLYAVQLRTIREFAETTWQYRDAKPLPLFPTAGGLLIWGCTFNGDILAWNTTGDPDTWTIDVYDGSYNEYEHFDMGFSEFLNNLGRGVLVSNLFPAELLLTLKPDFKVIRGLL